jgi:hypothetical protein
VPDRSHHSGFRPWLLGELLIPVFQPLGIYI